MKALLLIPLITALAYAQDADLLELRGIVFEIGPNTPLAGAQITVYQFDRDRVRRVFTNTVTDSGGAFQIKPTLPGDYYVEASKPDYFAADELPRAKAPRRSSTGALAKVNKDHPTEEFRFALMRLGELRGKAVDEDGKPLANLRVDLIPGTPIAMPALSSPFLMATRSIPTAADGSFDAAGLVPGNYVVCVSTGAMIMKRADTDFSADDETAVDQEVATTYWPGVHEQADAAITTVNPGGATDLGAVRVKKEPRYRIHFVVEGCEPGDQLTLPGPGASNIQELLNLQLGLPPGLGQTGLPCRDLLLRGFPAGSYRLIATTKHSAATTPFTITDRSVTVPLTLIANGDVVGRVVTASGDPPPPRQPGLRGMAGISILPDAKGNFTISGAPCIPGSLMLTGLNEPYYIKEFRVNGVAVSGNEVTLCAGSRVEIVLDDKVATLAVSITDGDKLASAATIFVEKWPASPLDNNPPSKPGQSKPGQSMALPFTKLAPGDYRVLAVRQVVLADGADLRTVLPQLWDRAAKITLDPGDAKSISVNVIDPFL